VQAVHLQLMPAAFVSGFDSPCLQVSCHISRSVHDAGMLRFVGHMNSAASAASDLKSCNSVVHMLDAVLLP